MRTSSRSRSPLPGEWPYLDRALRCNGILTIEEALWIFRTVRDLALEKKGRIRCVEIGSFEGRSTVAAAAGLLASGGCGSITAIDPLPSGSLAIFRENLGRAAVEHLVRHVRKLSWDCAEEIDGDIDFLFVDGDHSYDGARRDFLCYGPKLRSGGVIAFHDVTVSSVDLLDPNFTTGWTPVRRCFREAVVASPDWTEVGCTGSIGHAVRAAQPVGPSRQLSKRLYFDGWLGPRHAAAALLFALRQSPRLAPAVDRFHRLRRRLGSS